MTNDTRTCYYPSGEDAGSSNVPCSSDEYTSCCGQNDLCLSNGLCLSVSHQPYVLSRGACTDPQWGSNCSQYCQDNNPTGGCSIINLEYTDGVSTYCCGTPVANSDDEVVCPNNASSFEVPTGHAVVGYAMLANVSSLDATAKTTCSSSNTTTTVLATSTASCPSGASGHDTAIGAGVGVSLGVVALASIAWALFERRRATARKLVELPADPRQTAQVYTQPFQSGGGLVPAELDGAKRPSELATPHP
ncbi:uncharacterized protein BP01DRAFT_390173 [Aspergillus saccharolyticus JOP 1030-1]|uniref:Mid2 domain-containing protein n=1 Tax=Aspergillus saccharolyticus JOP 1030-1 TaxID=1450539 RepID=A0A319A4F9_9EURO|nr:hypothetical protein BP01DRAFT_390173 [Aspergillus saccharolyticus JOP 1030-1]PYH47028.1 hypothetical protein BP01DRAFT_390173 [Aspergillus saccharolyticus JOP 1030-1]